MALDVDADKSSIICFVWQVLLCSTSTYVNFMDVLFLYNIVHMLYTCSKRLEIIHGFVLICCSCNEHTFMSYISLYIGLSLFIVFELRMKRLCDYLAGSEKNENRKWKMKFINSHFSPPKNLHFLIECCNKHTNAHI